MSSGVGSIVLVSNTPTPYQLDLLQALADQGPVAGFFMCDRAQEQNVSWQLAQPAWLKIVPAGSGWQKACWILDRHRDVLPRLLILGGFRNPGSLWLLLWARWCKIPVWFWLENPLPQVGRLAWLKRLVRHILNAIVLPWATGVLAVDGRAERAYARYHAIVLRQPYAIMADKYVRMRAPHAGPLRCVFVGQLIDRKGVPELLAAFERIALTDAVLTLVGQGPLQADVQAFCSRTGHVLKGFVQPKDLPDVLAAQDVLVFPSRYDGWAVVVAEAMAAGLPVIANVNVGAFADLVRDGVEGLATPAQDADSLRRAVLRYVRQRDDAARHGAAAQVRLVTSNAEVRQACAGLHGLAQQPQRDGLE
jgi:glycosyltransferase involved in cell wall biosynthesis